MKPSDFPRDLRFRVPGPAFVEDGMAHVRSYRAVKRVMLDEDGEEFSKDVSYWTPAGQRLHLAWYFMWAQGKKRADGTPGRHDVLRKLVEPWFRNRAVKTMAPRVQQITETLVRAIVDKGTGELDLATELAYPLALRTICSLVGFPLEQERWIADQLNSFAQTPTVEQLQREPQEVEDYLWELVRRRRAHPQEELLDLLIAAWQDQAISDVELLAYIWGFCQAGTETTGPHIVNTVSLLSEFGLLDRARARLDDEDWLYAAGEEALRFAVPYPGGVALAVREVVLEDGVRIPAMTPVRIWFSAANRDQAINGGNANAASPDVFDVERSPNLHLTFATGMRYCLGASLARLESRIALQTALRSLPELVLDETKPFERYAGVNDGVTAAPFRFDQRKAELLLSGASGTS